MARRLECSCPACVFCSSFLFFILCIGQISSFLFLYIYSFLYICLQVHWHFSLSSAFCYWTYPVSLFLLFFSCKHGHGKGLQLINSCEVMQSYLKSIAKLYLQMWVSVAPNTRAEDPGRCWGVRACALCIPVRGSAGCIFLHSPCVFSGWSHTLTNVHAQHGDPRRPVKPRVLGCSPGSGLQARICTSTNFPGAMKLRHQVRGPPFGSRAFRRAGLERTSPHCSPRTRIPGP